MSSKNRNDEPQTITVHERPPISFPRLQIGTVRPRRLPLCFCHSATSRHLNILNVLSGTLDPLLRVTP
jgi:hypothetical protein